MYFVTKVLERDVIAISNAAVTLRSSGKAAATPAPAAAPSSSLVVKGFGASQVFTAIQAGLQGLSKEQRLGMVKKTKAVFAFEITNAEKKVQAWYVDVKVCALACNSRQL